MTQEETIRMIDSISPDIISSKDPEGTMLKCASKHNLSPAQLEHLGQVYNTTKSITGFDVMANRGDSFSIVDVPAMVSKYASYDPSKKLSEKSQDIHNKLNNSMSDDSSLEISFKVASERKHLPSLIAAVLKDVEIEDPDANTVKSASEKIADMRSVEEDLDAANEKFEQALFDAREDIREKCASVMSKLTPDMGRWAEVKSDLNRLYGEKSASAIERVEIYFRNNKHHTEDAQVKKASFGNLVQDKYGVLEDMKDIVELSSFLEKYAMVNPPGPNPNPNGNPNPPGPQSSKLVNLPTYEREPQDTKDSARPSNSNYDSVKSWDELYKSFLNTPSVVSGAMDSTFDRGERMLKLLGPSSNSRQRKIDEGLNNAAKETTIAQLMLNDKVIGSYDQDEVQDMFDNLSALSPVLASNPTMMAAALKEALQYGSIPVPIAKGIADLQKTVTDNERNQRSIDKEKYSY